jgi:hypothetical protein
MPHAWMEREMPGVAKRAECRTGTTYRYSRRRYGASMRLHRAAGEDPGTPSVVAERVATSRGLWVAGTAECLVQHGCLAQLVDADDASPELRRRRPALLVVRQAGLTKNALLDGGLRECLRRASNASVFGRARAQPHAFPN